MKNLKMRRKTVGVAPLDDPQKRNNGSQNTKYQIQNTQRGITLVALIITIIVLLILSGISISLLSR